MDNADLLLIEEGLSKIVATDDTVGIAARLEEFGWFALFDDEPGTAIQLLGRHQGLHSPRPSVLALVMETALGDPVATLAREEHGIALVLPALGNSRPPASVIAHTDIVEIDGLVLDGSAERFVLFADDGTVAEVTPPTNMVQPLGGLDPDLGLRQIVDQCSYIPTSLVDTTDPLKPWEDAVAAGRLGLASEMTEIGDRVLHSAVEYVSSRHQFGRALGSFQAVQHQLAEVEVDLAVARAAVMEAAADYGNSSRATLAKLLAGRAAIKATARAQQVFGGIGFTWEHGLHRDVRRVIALDSLLGSTAHLEREIGIQLCGYR